MVTVIPYENRHKTAFETIGLHWINQYLELTDKDKNILKNPEEEILQKGGHIFMAEKDGDSIGTVALIKTDSGTHELVKLGVLSNFRGLGVGRLLVEAVITKAQELNLNHISLESSRVLESALALYHKIGFEVDQQEEVNRSSQCDIRMVLNLKQ